eukprot:GSChrysophyteH1.ASY1.ANO1.588.1 assembled CDS
MDFVDGYTQLSTALSASFWPIYESWKNGAASPLFQHDAIGGLAWLYILVSAYCLIFAEISQNYSKVDQIWSITPWCYCWFLYAHWQHNHPGITHDRLLLVCMLTTIWGLRLTFNFWRRDGYGNLITHEEDYRWPILREKINNRFLFSLFNATFIAPYQNLILLLIALPAYQVMNAKERECSTFDIVLAIVFVCMVLVETVADQQHWNFHGKKNVATNEQKKVHPDPDVRDGFLQSGLFKYSRHPNYFAEQSLWMCFYCFTLTNISVASLKDLFNVYFLGELLLLSLFQGSMAFGESITAAKYPKYKIYQRRVSQCIPFFTTEDKSL